jgi:dihydropteroate synthase
MMHRQEFELDCGNHTLQLGKTTKIMGILNLTDDSFSADGVYKDPERATEIALQMVEDGADIIDLGGESTRPGATPVSLKEEKERVLPVLRKLVQSKIGVPISIDTTKAELAKAALAEGACIINDISGLRFDPQMGKSIAQFNAGCILMHIKGTPQTMQEYPFYTSLIKQIMESLKESISLAVASGVDRKKIIVDPGIGFGKNTEHNLQIIKGLRDFTSLDSPILIGTSRKSFIGNILSLPIEKRTLGTAATVAASILNGAHIVRVHDVKQMSQIVKMIDAIINS